VAFSAVDVLDCNRMLEFAVLSQQWCQLAFPGLDPVLRPILAAGLACLQQDP
jgi:hypothetical protein